MLGELSASRRLGLGVSRQLGLGGVEAAGLEGAAGARPGHLMHIGLEFAAVRILRRFV